VMAAAAVAMVTQAASEAAVGLVSDWSDVLATQLGEQIDAELTNRRWHMAAAEAVGVNGAIRLLTQQAGQLGLPVDLPIPITLNGRSLAEVAAWLTRTAPLIKQARRVMDRAVMDEEWKRLMASLPAITNDQSSIADALTRYRQTLQRRHAEAAKPALADPPSVDTEVQAVLSRLDPDANAQEWAAVLRAAAHVAGQNDEDDAQAYLFALRRKVDKDVNPRVAARRLAARSLEAFEQPVVQRAMAATPELLWAGVPTDLWEVVAGTAELTPELRDRMEAALAWAAGIARTAYRLDLLRGLLVKQGYQVQAQSDSGLRVTRAAWSGEHTADVWLDADSGVHAGLRSETTMHGDDAALRESERGAQLHRDMADAVHEMSHQGIGGLVGHAHAAQHRHGDEVIEQPGLAMQRPAPRQRRSDRPSGQ
jgi:hypothetical protein